MHRPSSLKRSLGETLMPLALRHRHDPSSMREPLPDLVIQRETDVALLAAVQGVAEPERTFDLPVRSGESVVALRPLPGAGFEVETAIAAYRADQVVVATGSFQRPWVPSARTASLPA